MDNQTQRNIYHICIISIDSTRVISLYSDNKFSIRKISELLNCSWATVKRILTQNNITIRNNSFYRSKQVDEHFFDNIDSEESAYILGFIYADGCLTKGNNLSFTVAEFDKEILEKIKKCLNSNHHIGTYIGNNGYVIGNKYCKLSICNKHLHDTLVNLGATERKTKGLKFPTWLRQDLIRHFIRGFFDGDGSVYYVKQADFVNCNFTGTFDMLSNIRNILHQEISTSASVYKYANKDIYDFKVGGKNKVIAFYNYLYKDASIFLSRKKDKFDEYIINDR